MTKQIDISDNISMLSLEVNAARVFIEAFNDKLDHMVGLFLDAEDKLQKAEARCKELQKLLNED